MEIMKTARKAIRTTKKQKRVLSEDQVKDLYFKNFIEELRKNNLLKESI